MTNTESYEYQEILITVTREYLDSKTLEELLYGLILLEIEHSEMAVCA